MTSKQNLTKEKPSKSRMIWGSIVLVTGFLSPLLIPLVLSSELSAAFKSVLSGLLAFGIPEIFMLIAIGIFGKAGFNYFKRIIGLYIKKYGPADEVSLLRYRIGLVMFSIPLIVGVLSPYLLNDIPFYSENMSLFTISLDVLLFTSVIVLGGNFWDKLRGLFIRSAKINFESN